MKQRNTVQFIIFFSAMFFLFTVDQTICQVIDKDGNLYKTVTISTQEWTTENLIVEHYRNGDAIPQVQDEKEWKKLTTGAWCYYENNTENGKTYGKLYNWYAVDDPRGLAPEGWHVPSDAEWTALAEYLGGKDVAGGKLKATTLWENPNKGATDESGFTAFPGGYNEDNGKFKFIGKSGYFWTSSKSTTIAAYRRALFHNNTDLGRDTYNKRCGLSIRCIKD
jgi:uncharacterized protein (TIGR02145 family)